MADPTDSIAISLRFRSGLFNGLGAACLLILAALTACGGGGTPSAAGMVVVGTPSPRPPIALVASLSTVKLLTLDWSWPDLGSVQRAIVLEDPDGDGPLPAEPLTDVPAADGTATVEIFLPVALQAGYQVALCNGAQCTYSDPVRLQGHLEQAMGRFKANTPLQDVEFGISLALSRDGQVMVVGDKTGSVHIFERTWPGQWTSHGPLQPPSPAIGSLHDRAIALSADASVLAFGAIALDNLGSAYLYRRQGNQWLFEAHLRGSDIGFDDDFGASLALSADGHTLAIGAPLVDGGTAGPHLDGGTVYVFTDSSGSWTQTRLLRDGNGVVDDGFGTSVALNANGTVLAVGSFANKAAGLGVYPAPIDDTSAPLTGAVYTYTLLPGNGSLDAFIKPPMDLGIGMFGSAVALDAEGNTLVVSASDADIDPQGIVDSNHLNSGSVHAFTRAPGGQWAPHGAPMRSPVPQKQDQFGQALALSGDGQTVVVGTLFDNNSGLGVASSESPVLADEESGSAFVFRHTADGWGAATVLQPSDYSTTGKRKVRLGSAVAISGDGRTVAVGARSHGGPGSGVSADPTIPYGDDMAFHASGAVFMY